MSTVLWANTLIDEKVRSDQSDKYALYKHSKKLDKITEEIQVTRFLSTHDSTDYEFNVSEKELPEGGHVNR